MEILWVIGAFFVFCLFIFFAVAIFFPEWVGITGKKAKDIMAHQQGHNLSLSNPNEDSRPENK